MRNAFALLTKGAYPQAFEECYDKNREDIRFFFVLALFLTFAYSAKIFSVSYTTDDYARFYATMPWYWESTFTGRWFSSILRHALFQKGLHVLPMLNAFIGVACLSATGTITTKAWGVTNRFERFFAATLIAVSIYWAKSLYFNISTAIIPIGTLLTSVGIYLLIKSLKKAPVGLLLIVCGFGTYQTTVQLAILIVLTWFIKFIFQEKSNSKQLVVKLFTLLGIIVFAYGLSDGINSLIVNLNDLTLWSRYAAKEFTLAHVASIFIHMGKLPSSGFHGNLPTALEFFLAGLAASAGGLAAWKLSSSPKRGALFVLLMLALCAYFFTSRLVFELPRAFGIYPPSRAYTSAGCMLAGFFLLAVRSRKGLIPLLGYVSAAIYILLSILSISMYYDGAQRQTASDIMRANQIVNRIRMDERFNFNEKNRPGFLIVGGKSFPVEGYKASQHPLAATPANYNLFLYFTDFRFKQVSAEEENILLRKLAATAGIASYPYKGSIQFIDNAIILIMDSSAVDKALHPKANE